MLHVRLENVVAPVIGLVKAVAAILTHRAAIHVGDLEQRRVGLAGREVGPGRFFGSRDLLEGLNNARHVHLGSRGSPIFFY